ncbi:MAG: DegT/DnrJ/EryC1/StrS family aminotransferase [Candidatus Geothermincolia bacterium]
MRVPFVDLKRDSSDIAGEILGAVESVIDGNRYILGPEVEAFESEFAAFNEVAHATGVASGTDALLISCMAAGLEKGDRVIVPANTFIATFDAVTRSGAIPLPVDPNPEFYTLDAAAVAGAIDERTRAVMPVHLYGQLAEVDEIASICDSRGITLIEDAAQAHGARYRGRRAGSFGVAGCFSFYPSKNLGALGDGGAIVTGDEGLLEGARMLRDYGQKRKNEHLTVGFNSRLDEIQAAVLRVKLRKLEANNAKRARAAELYAEGLGGMADVVTPAVRQGSDHIYHLYVVRCPRRDELKEFLAKREISTGLHYPIPAHMQPAYSFLGFGPGAFPVTERLCGEILSLPMFPSITAAEIEFVCDSIKAFYGSGGA